MKLSNSFLIALLALAAESVLSWYGKATGAVTAVAGLYIGARAGQKASAIYSASKDPECSTADIIEKLK